MKKVKNQKAFFAVDSSAYGGELQKKRKGRKGPRPLHTKYSMHLVVRSTKAKGKWNFRTPQNWGHIRRILNKFAKKWGVKLINGANVVNHLHLHIQIMNRHGYKPFIRAVTACIVMAITGASRWNPLTEKFWDHRPFTVIAETVTHELNLTDYIRINQLEGRGVDREIARLMVKGRWSSA